MERLQKVIARAGICSRRQAEELIAAGHVRVNGRVVKEVGSKVNPNADQIQVHGRILKPEPHVYVMLNKPSGVVTSLRDPQGRKTVVDLVPRHVRLVPVGRLDYDTEGLLLLTNDGELTYRLTHPSYEIEKVYVATLRGNVSNASIQKLRKGVALDDGVTWPAKARVLNRKSDQTTISLAIHEGRNRQVRRMGAAIGHPVLHLRRIAFGTLRLGDLPLGAWRYVSHDEVMNLYRQVGLSTDGFV